METILKAGFWFSAALLFHNYLFFGWTIRFLSVFAKPRNFESGELPSLTIIIAAYNEEQVIGRTLDGILAQEYPTDRMQVIVGSDVSTDQTNKIVSQYASRQVRLVAFKERHGKLGILDELIPTVESDIVVVMDANILLAPGALLKIGEGYRDPAVGAVCGRQTVELPGKTTQLKEEDRYRAQEVRLKEGLSRLGVVVGAFGGFYSFRREYFRPIGSKPMVDDVILPLEVLGQHKRVVFQSDAVAYEEIGGSPAEEFHRRIRMTGYNLNGFGRALRCGANSGLLALYVVFSYKILRWLSPYLLGLWAVAAVSLFKVGLVYRISAGLVGIALILALTGYVSSLAGKRIPISNSAYYFVLMNFALFLGLFRWMFGVKLFWQRAQR